MSQTINEQRLANISKEYETQIEEGLMQAMIAAKTLGEIEAVNNGRTHFADDATLAHIAQLQAKLDKAVAALDSAIKWGNEAMEDAECYCSGKAIHTCGSCIIKQGLKQCSDTLAEINNESKKDGN